MRVKKTVTLEVIHDIDTGLAFNLFRVLEDGVEIEMCMRVANRMQFGKIYPCLALSYDPAFDGAIAESERYWMEQHVNGLAFGVNP